MALTVIQGPNYKTIPAQSKLIFGVSDTTIVANETGVKYKCEIYVSDSSAIPQTLVATLKTSPNGAGTGMFDLRPIIESYVKPNHLGTREDLGSQTFTTSQFKTVDFGEYNKFPVHVIDRYALGVDTVKFLSFIFYVEYLGADNSIVDSGQDFGVYNYFIYNGVLYHEDILTQGFSSHNFGYDLDAYNFIMNDSDAKFLTNAPTTQYARLTDYGTLSFFTQFNSSSQSFETSPSGTAASENAVNVVKLKMYNSSDVQLGVTQNINNAVGSEGGSGASGLNLCFARLLFMGAYPANLRGWNTAFNTHLANISYYTLQAEDDSGNAVSQLYTINIICDSPKGYEAIRLAWLNKFGVWDYYTFTMKSIRGLTTNRTTYTQLDGTWNDEFYIPYSYKGGQKNFRINAKERLTLNTDFLNNDNESAWLEELINSSEVYIIKEFDSTYTPSTSISSFNRYVEPVRVTNSNFVRKTAANDNLIQYTIEIERNKNQRTHTG